ncbi:hypothetical protein GGS24DRAFT_473132 [Hypoxylon argillaceum]|nr:hypothetical protein GGS24DRAFT_473132 [Hypoxylon argillaceum]
MYAYARPGRCFLCLARVPLACSAQPSPIRNQLSHEINTEVNKYHQQHRQCQQHQQHQLHRCNFLDSSCICSR